MKNRLLYIALVCVGLLGCNEILDRDPAYQLGSNTMWTSEDLVNQGVSGAYQALRNPVKSGSVVGASHNIGYYGWEVFGMTGQSRLNVGGVFGSSVTPGNEHFSESWKWHYNGIYKANDVIVNVPSSPIKEEQKACYIAEAKVLRSFYYMRLNELFGRGIGIPIYTTPIGPTEATNTQTSEADVWNFIIQDLTDAIKTDDFPNNTIGKSGKVSKGTAYALRGRAYLLSSMSLGIDRYDLAAKDFEKVGEMGYGLFEGGYETLFKVANENCKEIIFSVQNIEDPIGYGSYIQKYCAPWNAGTKYDRTCWTDISLTPAVVDLYEVKIDNTTVKAFNWNDIIPGYNETTYDGRVTYFIRDYQKNGVDIDPSITNVVNNKLNSVPEPYKSKYLPEGNEARIRKAYENRDPRLEASVITPYSTFLGVNSTSSEIGEYAFRWPTSGKYYFDQTNSESMLVPGMMTSLVANGNAYFYYMFRKFIGTGIEYTRRENCPIDEPIIRYADVLLMWAEALIEKNELSAAQAIVKQVRDRVDMPTMDVYFSDQTIARNYVRDERRREFVGEGINFFDEMRWKTLKETKFEYGPKTSMQVWGGIATGSPVYSWTDYWYTWPVPRKELEINTNLQKTPGWSY